MVLYHKIAAHLAYLMSKDQKAHQDLEDTILDIRLMSSKQVNFWSFLMCGTFSEGVGVPVIISQESTPE